MKKTLIALAALAAAGASFAGATAYAKLDAAFVNKSTGGTSVGMSGYETSRFGVKAEEKVGSLTYSAVLEGKVWDASKDGQATFVGFDRTATVGVSGSMGTITVGNQWTPFDNAVWTSDAGEYSGAFTVLEATTAWATDLGNTGMGNAKNSIQFATPVINGFQGIVLAAPNVTGNTQGATNYSGVGINYANGPLVINFATQAFSGTFTDKKAELKSDGGTVINAAADSVQNTSPTVNSMVLAVNYDFGAAKAYGGIINSDPGVADKGKDASYVVGVAIPFSADSLRLSYAGNKSSISGQADVTSSAWAALYLKPLSKAAMGYAGVKSLSKGSASAVTTSGVGIRYDF